MKYVNEVLIEGEKIIHAGHFHWIQAFKAILALVTLSWLFGFGIFVFVNYLLVRYSTEMVVTNRRLIYKMGVLSRRVHEINIDSIESSNVVQSILGRLLGYGGIAVHGSGIGEIVLPQIAEPIAFSKALDRAEQALHQERAK